MAKAQLTHQDVLNMIAETNKTADRALRLIQELNEKEKKQALEREKERIERKQERKQRDKKMNQLESLFTSQWGKLIESLVEGDLIKLLNSRGLNLYDVSSRIAGCRNDQNYEFDLIAHNGHEIVIVEVKTTLRVKHVKEFIDKLKQAKTLLPRYKNNTILGGIAFLKADEQSPIYAQKNGLYVIKATGSSSSVINASNFQPKIF